MNAVEQAAHDLIDTRVPTKWGKRELADLAIIDRYEDYGDLLDPLKSASDKKQLSKSSGAGASEDSVKKTRSFKNINQSLSVKAGQTAARIKNNGPRIVGLLECAGSNRKWVAAVLTSIASTGIRMNTRKPWIDSFMNDGKMNSKEAREAVIMLENSIKLWVNSFDTLRNDVSDESPKELLDSKRGRMGTVETRSALITNIALSGVVPSLVSERLYPFCIISDLKGEFIENVNVSSNVSYADAFKTYHESVDMNDVSGWINKNA